MVLAHRTLVSTLNPLMRICFPKAPHVPPVSVPPVSLSAQRTQESWLSLFESRSASRPQPALKMRAFHWNPCTELHFCILYPCPTPEGDAFGTNYPWAQCHSFWLYFGISRPDRTERSLESQHCPPLYFTIIIVISFAQNIYSLQVSSLCSPQTPPIYIFSLSVQCLEGEGLASLLFRLLCLPKLAGLWVFKGILVIL